MYKESSWNLKDLLKSHEGKEFDSVLADLDSKVKKVESSKSKLTNNISSEKVLQIIKDIEEVEKFVQDLVLIHICGSLLIQSLRMQELCRIRLVS